MQVSVETLGTIGRRVTVAVPADQVEKEVVERLKRLAKTARLPGFRPGKAPLKVIENKFGGEVLNEVAGSLIASSLKQALAQEELMPAGGPEVEPKKLGRGQDLEYVAKFDIYPDIKRLDISGVKMERPVYDVDASDIDATIETMRVQRKSWRPVEREARDGDQVVIDFDGTIDGEPFAGGKAEDYALLLGEQSLLTEFEEGLKGRTKGERVELQVHFPEDYHGREVAGRHAVFTVTVKQVNEAVLPEIDEDFARSFGIKDGDLEKLREEVRENVEREMAERVRRILRERVLSALVEVNDIELPAKLVDAEIDHMIASNKAMLESQGLPVRNITPDRSRFREDAERRVTLGLVMREIIQKHDLKPDPDRVRERVKSMASEYEDADAFVQWYYSDRQRINQLESVILEEQVIERLLETAEVSDRRMSFEELKAQQAG